MQQDNVVPNQTKACLGTFIVGKHTLVTAYSFGPSLVQFVTGTLAFSLERHASVGEELTLQIALGLFREFGDVLRITDFDALFVGWQ